MQRCQFSLLFVAALGPACGLDTNGLDTATASASQSSDTTSITDADPPTSSATGNGTPPEVACIDDTGTIPDGFVDTYYSLLLSAAGDAPPYTWQASGLPDGLVLTVDPTDSSRATVEGYPTAAGDYNVEITVTDADDRGVPTSCGALLIRNPVQVDHGNLFADLGGCIPVGDGSFDSLSDLFNQGTLGGDQDFPITCELAPDRGNGSGDFDKDADTPDTMPLGITLDADTCTVGGSITSTLAYGIYGFIVTYTQSTSASTAHAYIPYCAANMTQTPGAYGVMREDTGNVATFLPGIQQLSPGEAVDYGTLDPDPKFTVTYGIPCASSCYYAFVFAYNTLSGFASVSANPNAKFPETGFEGFTHGLRFDEADAELLASFADRAWVINITFDYCIAQNNTDCGNAEPDFAKRAEKIRQNGNGSNYYFSLVLLPE